MSLTIEATYDGEVLRPESPLGLEPNTRVRLVVEPLDIENKEPYAFLRLARSMNLDGPPDWSANIDKYLYGHDDSAEK